MNLTHFAAFRAVMLTGTVSGAAEVLGRTQPAVSRLLSRLEYDLGLPLFERRKGLVTPTREAHQLLDEIERAYVSLESLQSFALRLAKGQSAHVTTAVMPALGLHLMPQVFERFRQQWPLVKLTLNVLMSSKIEEWAAAQQIDFGLAEMPFTRSGFSVEVFSQAPYVAAVPASHPLADRTSIGPKDFAQGPMISWTSFLTGRHLLDQALHLAGATFEVEYETTFSATAYEMVKRGLGIALIDPFTAAYNVDEPKVRLIPFVPAIPFNVALLRPETRPRSPAIEAMLQFVMEERDRLHTDLPR